MLNILIGQSDRPNRVTTKDKNESYHTDFARYSIFQGYNYLHQNFISNTKINKQFYKNDQWIFDEDLEAFFMDDTGGVRNRIKIVKNMIKPMLVQYRGNAIRMQINAKCKSTSIKAINRREEKLKEMLFFSKIASKLEQDGAPEMAKSIRKKLPIGENQAETQKIMENVWVDNYVEVMNGLMEYIANENRLSSKQDKIAENLALSGIAVMETYEHAGHQVFKVVESEDFFWDRSARSFNLDDAEFQGMVAYLSPTEIYERWPKINDNQRIAIDNYSRQFYHRLFDNTTENISLSGKVPVFRIYWRDSEEITYGYVKDEFGYPYLTKINFIEPGNQAPRYTEKDLIEPPDEDSQDLFKGKMTRNMYVDMLRFAEMIPKEFMATEEDDKASDITLEWGVAEYQETENEKPWNIKFPFKCHTWGYVDGEVMSPIDDVINPQRFINRLLSIAENQVNNSRGSGMIYDKDLVDSQEGESELLRNANQSKPIGIRARGKGIQNAVGMYDGTVKQGTMAMFEIIDVMKNYVQDITGVNEALKGESTGSDQLVGVTQLLIQRGSLMQEPFYNAITEVYLQCYQSMLNFGKMIYARDKRGLAMAVGDKGAKVIQISKEMIAEDFRAFVARENSDDMLISAANQQLMTFLQIGLIDKERFSNLYGRSNPDDVSRALREAVIENQEIQRMSDRDKKEKSEQMQQAIAKNNEVQLARQQQMEQQAQNQDSKNKQHDLDKILTQGMVKRAVQTDKTKGEILKAEIEKGSPTNSI